MIRLLFFYMFALSSVVAGLAIIASTNTDHFDIFTQLRILLYVFVYFVNYWRLLLTNWAIEAKDLNKY